MLLMTERRPLKWALRTRKSIRGWVDSLSVGEVRFTFDFVLGQAGDGYSNDQDNHADQTNSAELSLAEWS